MLPASHPLRRLVEVTASLGRADGAAEFRSALVRGLTDAAVAFELREQPLETPPEIGITIVARGRVFWVLQLGGDVLPVEEPLLLELITANLSAALEAALRTEEQRNALGVVHAVGQSVVGTLQLDRLLEQAAATMARSFDADIYLMLPDAAQETLVVQAVAGSRPGLLGKAIPIEPHDQSIGAWVFRRKETVRVEDGETDPRTWVVRKLSGGRAYLAAPLVVRDLAIGCAVLVETRGPRRFGPEEVTRFEAVANQLAVAVANARLYEDLQRSYSELGRAQSQLVQRERLAALGELAALVAHEIRNPLGAIFNSVSALRKTAEPEASRLPLLEIIVEEAERLNAIVTELLEFAKPSTLTLRAKQLWPIVEDALQAVIREGAGAIEVVRELEPELPKVPLDARLIRQALLNLIQNAVQAMGGRGTLTLRARALGTVVQLQIADTGGGIPPEVLPRIFEPFFTTKAKGTGLGLPLVKRVMDTHLGAIRIDTEPGRGTVVTIELPRLIREGDEPRDPSRSP